MRADFVIKRLGLTAERKKVALYFLSVTLKMAANLQFYGHERVMVFLS